MITTDRMDRILIDLTMGDDPKPRTAEERQFVGKVRKEIRQAEADKQEVRIPPEWQV